MILVLTLIKGFLSGRVGEGVTVAREWGGFARGKSGMLMGRID